MSSSQANSGTPPITNGHCPPARMKNPAFVLPEVFQSIKQLIGTVQKQGVPNGLLQLVHMRASQINGCSACVDSGTKHAKKTGETLERMLAVSAWRESPHFTEAERAALALTEAVTRLSDRSDPVPDDVWAEATRHFDERAMSTLLVQIALVNVFNRLNVSVRQPPTDW